LKAQLAEHNKTLKKALKIAEQDANAIVIPEKGYIDASDLSPRPPSPRQYVPPSPPETKCFICQDPVYFYEKQDPPTCFWCEIKVLDSEEGIC